MRLHLFSTIYLDLYCNRAVKCLYFDSGPDPRVFNLRAPPGNLRLHFAVLFNGISHYCFMML